MSSLRWRFAWRDLWLHKGRTLAVILSIAIGVFTFGAILAAYNTMRTDMRINFLSIDPAHSVLHASLFDTDQADAVARMPQVAAAEGRSVTVVRFLKGGQERHDLQLIALDDYETNVIDRILPESGAWPPPKNAALVERNSIGLTGLAVGDQLQIELPNNRWRTLPIAGLVHDMNQPPAFMTGTPYVYVTRDTLEWLGLPRGMNRLHLRVATDGGDQAHISAVAQAAADKMERAGKTVFWVQVPKPGEHFAEQFMPTVLMILFSLGLLSVVLSGFLVVNVISAILTQHRRQIGVMKSIGARAGLIFRLYMRMVLTFGLAALLLAVPAGTLGGFIFSRFMASQLNFDLDRLRIAPWVLVLEAVIALLIPVAAALIPIRQTAQASVREAIQDSGLERGADTAKLDRAFVRMQEHLPLSRPARLSLRNTFRRRGRLARTLVPLALAGAMFMSVLSVRASLYRTLEDLLDRQGFDVQVQFRRPVHIPIVEHAAEIPGVTAAEAWTVRQGVPLHADGSEGDEVIVMALPPDTKLFRPQIVAGRWLDGADRRAVVVAESLRYKGVDIRPGQTLTLKIGGEETTWEIVGVNRIFQPPIGPRAVYVPQEELWRTLGGVRRVDTLRVLTVDDDPLTHARVSANLQEQLERAGVSIRSTRTATEDRRIFSQRFDLIAVIQLILAVMMAAVGGLGLSGTMSINVLERKREIGVMRAIGASTQSILRIFVLEGMVIGVLSWVMALLLAQVMARLMSLAVGWVFAKLPLLFVFDLAAPFLWLLLVVGVAAGASLAPAWNAARLRVAETLAYE